MQFNPHRDDLLASCGARGELFVTTLENPGDPFRLGAARPDDFDAIDWNKKVAHILATGSSGGYASVWDVRSKKESISLNNLNRRAVTAVAWDPESPTKIATATSYDQEPVCVLWDLRNSSAPERVLRLHDQGVLSLSWSKADPRLLLSCGKDNRTVCWNARSGEALAEFQMGAIGTFQTSWNPRHPDMLATASFDGKIGIQKIQNTNSDTASLAASQALDGEDFFATAQSRPQGASFSLPVAPSWMERPVTATFGFGGKLVRAHVTKSEPRVSKVGISTFFAESTIGEESQSFEEVVKSGDFKAFCETKASNASTKSEKADWAVIETLISGSRSKLKECLGFAASAQTNGDAAPEKPVAELDGNGGSLFNNDSDEDFLSGITATRGAVTDGPFQVYGGEKSESDRKITQALILGNFETALDVCLEENRMADAFMVAICGSEKCIDKAKSAFFKQASGGPSYLRILASISGKNLWDMVHNADLKDWKEIMAAICTYADDKDFPDLCESLGKRLEENARDSGDASFCYLVGSKLPRVVSIWLEELKMLEATMVDKSDDEASFFSIHASALQQFIEKVTVFRHVSRFHDDEHAKSDGWTLDPLYQKYVEYADVLSSQGHLDTAERYLALLPPKYPAAEVARNRVSQATRKLAAASAATKASQRSMASVQGYNSNPRQQGYGSAAQPQGYSSSAQPQTYNPPAQQQAVHSTASRSTYTPTNYQAAYQPVQQGYQPPGAAYPPPQPFAGQQFGAAPPPPRQASVSPAIPPASRVTNLESWNDTPDFGMKPIPRRGTPSVVGPPVVPSYAAQPPSAAPPQSGYGAPPKSTTPIPPPPKAGTARVASPANVAMHAAAQDRRQPSSAANTYSPPPNVQIPPAAAVPPMARGPSPYNPPPAGSSSSNRYAPAPGSQPIQPPGSTGGPPPASTMPAAYGGRPSPYAGGPVTPRAELPGAVTPIATMPPGPPPRGPAVSRIQPPPSGPGSRGVTLPSPQPSDSRPGSSGEAQDMNAAPKYGIVPSRSMSDC